jgi:hypothetical protein
MIGLGRAAIPGGAPSSKLCRAAVFNDLERRRPSCARVAGLAQASPGALEKELR